MIFTICAWKYVFSHLWITDHQGTDLWSATIYRVCSLKINRPSIQLLRSPRCLDEQSPRRRISDVQFSEICWKAADSWFTCVFNSWKDFHVFHWNDPNLAHRDEVAGGAVGVQHLDGLAEGDVSHCERSRKAGRRPDPVVVMQVVQKSGLDCSPQLCLDIVERLSNIVDVLVCLGHKIDVKRMSHYLVVILCYWGHVGLKRPGRARFKILNGLWGAQKLGKKYLSLLTRCQYLYCTVGFWLSECKSSP